MGDVGRLKEAIESLCVCVCVFLKAWDASLAMLGARIAGMTILLGAR